MDPFLSERLEELAVELESEADFLRMDYTAMRSNNDGGTIYRAAAVIRDLIRDYDG